MEPELVVKFKGDLADWNSAINKAKADMTALANQAARMAAAFNATRGSTGASATAINTLNASMNSLRRQMATSATATQSNTAALNANTTALGQNRGATDGASNSMGSFLKGYLSVAAVMQAGKVFLDSTKEVQKFENQLKVASGTQRDYAKNTQFLEGLAAKYNKNVLDLGANFAQLTIATRGTNLEGEKTERLFAAVTATSAALQMSVDDTNGTFRAFIQMVSKGNVQAEELRGQLGERLYGAFNLAAKSMGVTTQQLNKMLEQGEVLADELLPKLTVELEKSFGSTAQENAQNLGSSIEYATGQMTMLIAELGKTSGTTDGVTSLTSKFGEFLTKLRLVNKEYGFLTTLIAGASAAGTVLIPGEVSALDEYATKAKAKQPAAKIPNSVKYPLPGQLNGSWGSIMSGQSVIGKLPEADKPIIGGPSPAEEKKRKAAEVAARKADAAARKWVTEQIKLSNDRLAEGLLDAKIAQEQHYQGRPGQGLGTRSNTGTKQVYGEDLKSVTTQFNNQGGNALSTKHIEEQINAIGRSANAWGVEAKKKSESALASKNLNAEIAESTLALDNLNQNLQQIADQGKVEFFSGLGESLGALMVDASSIENVGDRIAMIMGDMIAQIGKAIVAYAFTMKGLKEALKASFSSPYVALAVGIAAIAAGTGLKAAAAKRTSDGAKKMWTGGVVGGPGGLDKVPTMLTRGEMVLNKDQQSTLLGIANGAMSGLELSRGNSRPVARRESVHVVVEGQLRNDRIEISNRRGARSNKYFE